MNKFCPSCGEPRKEGAAFCSECGKPYADAPDASPVPAPAVETKKNGFVQFIKIAAPYLLIVVLLLSVISAISLIPTDDKEVVTVVMNTSNKEKLEVPVTMKVFTETRNDSGTNHLLPFCNILSLLAFAVSAIISIVGIIKAFVKQKDVASNFKAANRVAFFGSALYIILIYSMFFKTQTIFNAKLISFVMPPVVVLVTLGVSLVLDIVMSVYTKKVK